MKFSIDDRELDFAPWTRDAGKVFDSTFAFFPGTTGSDEARPWLTATFVVGVAYDGHQGCLVARADLPGFFADHEGVRFAMHDAAAGLDTIHAAAPASDIYRWVDADLVACTLILHRLLALATEGHTEPDPRRWTLDSCIKAHPGVALAGGRREASGRQVDRAYGAWLNKPIRDIDPPHLEPLVAGAVALHALHHRLRTSIRHHLAEHAEGA